MQLYHDPENGTLAVKIPMSATADTAAAMIADDLSPEWVDEIGHQFNDDEGDFFAEEVERRIKDVLVAYALQRIKASGTDELGMFALVETPFGDGHLQVHTPDPEGSGI